MSIQYVDKNGDAVGTVSDTYNISGSNDQFSIAIDGGSNQVFTLTHGAARTAAQVVADMSALTSATASVATVNGVNYVRVRTTSASGASSTILVNAPSNNANTILGFTATTYTGGTNVNSTFVSGVSGTDKQSVVTGIEDALNSAGWITISGHHSAPTLMQSAMSPSSQNLRMQLNMTITNTNCANLAIWNVPHTKQATNGTNNGGMLLPGTSQTFRVVANKYQAFVFVPASSAARSYVGFGIVNVPSFLQGTVYEAIWLAGNAINDTDSTARGSFRTVLGSNDGSTNTANQQLICNGNLWEVANSATTVGNGIMSLITMFQGVRVNQNAATWYRWHDTSAFLTDPIISWGLTANTDEGLGRGQLWDAFISTESYVIDTTLSSIDSHNWWGLTSANGGSATVARGTLFVVAP